MPGRPGLHCTAEQTCPRRRGVKILFISPAPAFVSHRLYSQDTFENKVYRDVRGARHSGLWPQEDRMGSRKLWGEGLPHRPERSCGLAKITQEVAGRRQGMSKRSFPVAVDIRVNRPRALQCSRGGQSTHLGLTCAWL